MRLVGSTSPPPCHPLTRPRPHGYLKCCASMRFAFLIASLHSTLVVLGFLSPTQPTIYEVLNHVPGEQGRAVDFSVTHRPRRRAVDTQPTYHDGLYGMTALQVMQAESLE